MSDRIFEITSHDGRPCQMATCKCGATVVNHLNTGPASDEKLATVFAKKGWNIDLRGRRFLCPDCIAAAVSVRREQKKEKRSMNKQAAVDPQPPLPSEDTVLAKQIMMELLCKAYDLKARDYRTGWSDKRISDESKLSVEFVAKRRAEDFGPASPPKPPILREIKQKIDALENIAKDRVESLEKIYGQIINERAAAKTLLSHVAALGSLVAEGVKGLPE